MSTIIKDLRSILLQGRFQQVLNKIDGILPGSPDCCDAQILKLRCLLEQGRIKVASTFAESIWEQAEHQNNKLKLWAAYTFIYGEKLQLSPDRWQTLENSCTEALTNDTTDAGLSALALDLQSRLIFWRISFGLESHQQRKIALEKMAQAIEHYQVAGEYLDALGAKQRQAHFCRSQPYANLPLARQILTEVQQEALKSEYLVTAASAQLSLAEMSFVALQESSQEDRDFGALLELFKASAQRYEDAHHAFGEAKVCLSLGTLMLKYGFTDGISLVQEAISELAKSDENILQQEGWRTLQIWHTHHGDPKAAEKALEETNRLSAQMQFDLSESIDLLAEADTAFRQGNVAKAREILNQAVACGKVELSPGYRLMLASVTTSIGLDTQAENILRETIKDLEVRGISPFLTDAWFLLANLLEKQNPEEALHCINRAIQIDESLEDALQLGQHLCSRAWLQVQHRRRTAQSPIITNDITVDFDRARTALLPLMTLDGRMSLGTLCQRWGQAEFMDKNWEQCGKWLTLAEQLFEEYQLLPELAFTLSYQGLVFIEIARLQGPQTYDLAIERFEKTQAIFEQAGLRGVLWRAIFYQGLGHYEAGRWEAMDNDQRTQRWKLARHFLDEAASQVDQLRGFSDSGTALQKQMTHIAFGVDKQTIYDVGFQLTWYWQKNNSEALVWLERMKGRALLDALADMTLPTTQLNRHPLILQEQQLRERKHRATDVDEAITIQAGIDALLQQMSTQPETAGFAALRQGEPPQWVTLQKQLECEQELAEQKVLFIAEFYCSPQLILMFGMRADWDEPKVRPIDLSYSKLAQFIRMTFRQADGVRIMLEDFGDVMWQQFASLLSPLAEWTKPGDIICLIPHNILHDLPLHTLRLDKLYLIDRNPVFYAPSLSVLQHTLSREPQYSSRVSPKIAVFGDSENNLPKARIEAQLISEAMGATAILGHDVKREAVLESLTNTDIFHFCGHGELSANNGLDSGLHLANGDLLRASDLFALHTKTDLVALSGCETGVSQHHAGDELVGLVRSLLYAGASALLVSQWRVSDGSTMALLKAFYQLAFGDARVSKVEALQQATIAVRENSQWQSFYHWGGFVLIGDWK